MNPKEKSILKRYRQLSEEQRQSFEDYLDFLLSRQTPAAQSEVVDIPLDIERPPDETVIKAMRRLTKTYPMLETGELFSEASSLMSQNVLQGRPANEVIDDLELLFKKHYELRTQPSQ